MADMPDYPKVITESDVDLVVTEGAHTRLNKPEVMELLKSSRTKTLVITHRYDQVNPDGAVAELVEYTKDRFETVLAYDNMIWEL
jgi:hypothetical protein